MIQPIFLRVITKKEKSISSYKNMHLEYSHKAKMRRLVEEKGLSKPNISQHNYFTKPTMVRNASHGGFLICWKKTIRISFTMKICILFVIKPFSKSDSY
jgi:hypothetical protein